MRVATRVGEMMPARGRRSGIGVALLAALVLGASSGCALLNRKSDEEAEAREPTTVRVENQAFLDMNIYVWRGGQRIRLGTASGNSTTKFNIPASLIFGATPLRFQADPIGGNRQPISQEITVTPGDEVVLTIPPS